jgi:site-specific DNA-methyltransferase (adenine-specific)
MMMENRTLFIADNLDVMRGMNTQTVDLIYLDPPFNSKKQYKAPIGSPAEGAEFKDIWTDEDIKYEWHGQIAEQNEELYQIIQASSVVYDKSMKIYLTAMAVRLFEMKRILKPTGSIYLHCDPTASHYLKLVMDSLFGKQNFRNEIVWNSSTGVKNNVKSRFGRGHDIILFYGMPKAKFNVQYDPLSEEYLKSHYTYTDEHGRRFQPGDLNAPSTGGHRYEFLGVTKNWRMTEEQAHQWLAEGRIVHQGITPESRVKIPRYKRYADESMGRPALDNWTEIGALNSQAKESTGWPTQKPLELLHRIIKASSNEGDVVLDPFCGCATACVAAEQLGRQWMGIDISPSAEVITKLRLQEEVDKQSDLWNPLEDIIVRTDAPVRTDSEETATQIRLPKADTYKHELYGEQEGKCAGCNYFLPFRNMTIDHIVPQSKGGTDVKENLQLLCNACNATKGTRSISEFITILQEQGVRQK